MSPQRWRQVQDLFAAALDQPPEMRTAFLLDACGSDAALREEVESLLASDHRAARFLCRPVQGHRGALHDELGEADRITAGERVGSYRLLRPIAAGGMGSVWLAERADEQFSSRAAVKLIKRGMDTDDLLHRFRQERQVLANLHHPNISRPLDGGATPDGRPFLVMEFVEGEPIDRYCDRKRLTIRARLELFRKVCAAVHAAHQNLVVHRDLKPSNILVNEAGEPTLLDFGIAKVLSGDLGDATGRVTAADQRPMTLGYASPEQIRGQPITTASDVYSLGVVLYQLLIGRSPYELAGYAARDYEHAICVQEPARPSAAVLGRPGDVASVTSLNEAAERRATDGKRLRRLLWGDLDNIVLMALRTEPQRRYGSAEQLSLDLRRYLSREPIAARPDTFAYRTTKFVSRHRAAVASAAVFLLLVAIATMGLSLQARQLTLERNAAVAAHDKAFAESVRAQHEARNAQQSLRFLEQVFGSIDPESAEAADPTVRGVLDEAARRLETDTPTEPQIEAAVRGTIGRTYASIGAYAAAERHLLQALLLREKAPGTAPADLAASRHDLGVLRIHQGDFAAAETLLREAVEAQRHLAADDQSDVVASLNALTTALTGQARYDEAELTAHAALEISRRMPPDERLDTAAALSHLGLLRAIRGDFAGAEPHYRTALEIRRRLLGDAHLSVARSLNSLGTVLENQRDFCGAEELYRQALSVGRRALGHEHKDVAIGLSNVAGALREQGRFAEAEQLLRQALELARRTAGDAHPATATVLLNLARVLLRVERFAEAEPLAREVVTIRERVLPAGHDQLAAAHVLLACCLRELGRFDEAEPLFLKALAAQSAKFGHANPRTQSTLAQLVRFYEVAGRLDEAAEYSAMLSTPGDAAAAARADGQLAPGRGQQPD